MVDCRTGSPSSARRVPIGTSASRSARRWLSSRSARARNSDAATANTHSAETPIAASVTASCPGATSTDGTSAERLRREEPDQEDGVPQGDHQAGPVRDEQRHRDQLQVDEEPERARRAARRVGREREEGAVEEEHPGGHDRPAALGVPRRPLDDERDDRVADRDRGKDLRWEHQRCRSGDGERERGGRDREPQPHEVARAVRDGGGIETRGIRAHGVRSHEPTVTHASTGGPCVDGGIARTHRPSRATAVRGGHPRLRDHGRGGTRPAVRSRAIRSGPRGRGVRSPVRDGTAVRHAQSTASHPAGSGRHRPKVARRPAEGVVIARFRALFARFVPPVPCCSRS